MTGIVWTDEVWNPTTGCDKASPGCEHCYALTMARRLKAMGRPEYQQDGDPRTSGPGFAVREHRTRLTAPLGWRKPRRVFVNSMSDLFHPQVSDEFIARVLAVIALTPQHTYQVLTKRSARMRSFLADACGCHAAGVELRSAMAWAVSKANPDRIPGCGMDAERTVYGAPWPLRNLWVGVSAEDQERARRLDDLAATPAAVRWVSAEPLLGPLDLSPWLGSSLDWVVTGGESGPGARPADLDWFRAIRDQCLETRIAYLHKQHGGRTSDHGGRVLDGQIWDEYPTRQAAQW